MPDHILTPAEPPPKPRGCPPKNDGPAAKEKGCGIGTPVTGAFAVASSAEREAARSNALQECVRLGAHIPRVRVAATKEKQMARQVELNLELKRVEAVRAAAGTNL